jgi:hypothetical protein
MWLPTHMFLLLAIGITFLRWFIDSDRKSRQNFESAENGTLLKNDLEKLGV